MEKRVTYIPEIRSRVEKKVGIYCRVSTNDTEQLNSLINQISSLTRLVALVDRWRLVDIYIDIASAKANTSRKEFTRMIQDCQEKKINVIVTKSLSRFGRDTVDTLEALKKLREADVRVIFKQENLDTTEIDAHLMISIIGSFAQAENENRSENIKWGIRQRASEGISKLYDRKCYGYDHDKNGKLFINDEQASVVKKIFNWYLEGKSIIGILKELEALEIKFLTGKDK